MSLLRLPARAFALVLVTAPLALGACTLTSAQGKTVHLDPDVDDGLGGTGVESGDIRAAAERISRGLSSLSLENGRPRVLVTPVTNHTRFRIDSQILTNRLTTELVKRGRGRYAFVAEEGRPERAPAGNYVLVGEMRSLTKASGEATSDYIHYSFLLLEGQSGAVVWAEDFETKKKSAVHVVYQ